MNTRTLWLLLAAVLLAAAIPAFCDEEEAAAETAEAEVEAKEAEMKLDGLTVEETKALREKMEKHNYESDTKKILNLLIHSLYTKKEVALRELISNSADALSKAQFLSLTNPDYLGETTDLKILIHADKENKVLHITDTGVGMTREELVKNLGTIARSGTSEFLTKITDGQGDANSLIGQFGVGFYSAFLIADTVVVTSKHNDDKQHIWESDASSFSVTEDPREDEQLGRGTRISLYLKEEAEDFLEPNTLRDLVKRYSEFIPYDIYLYQSKTIEVEEEDEEEDEAAADEEGADEEGAEDDAEVEDDEEEAAEDEAATGEKKMVKKTVWDWEVINANKPIWTRNAKEIEEEEYNKFFKSFAGDEKDPLGHIHFSAEGEVTFRSILFIPAEAPPNFYNEYGNKKTSSIKLFVRRVFISDEFEDLLPKYLSFMKGIVDSDDLPLNVSREQLQQSKILKVIKKKLVRKALEAIKKLSEEDMKKFWSAWGTAIKLGIIEDYSNRTRLAKLLRFYSSNSDDELTSLQGYVDRMKEGQEHIFYIAGQSREEVEASPFTERLLKRGYEVLYLTEAIDEYTLNSLPEFNEKKLQNVAKEGLKLKDDENEAAKKYEEELETKFKPLTTWFGENMAEVIDKAVITNRLSDSPCALVASAYGWSGNFERIAAAQAYAKADDSSNSFYAKQKKTLEINPRHPLIKKLLERVEAESDDTSEDDKTTTKSMAQVLVDTARLRSGFMLQDSPAFAARIERMLRLGLGVDLDEKVEEEPEFEDEVDEEEEGEEVDDEEEGEGDAEGDAEGEESEGADAEAEEGHDEL